MTVLFFSPNYNLQWHYPGIYFSNRHKPSTAVMYVLWLFVTCDSYLVFSFAIAMPSFSLRWYFHAHIVHINRLKSSMIHSPPLVTRKNRKIQSLLSESSESWIWLPFYKRDTPLRESLLNFSCSRHRSIQNLPVNSDEEFARERQTWKPKLALTFSMAY